MFYFSSGVRELGQRLLAPATTLSNAGTRLTVPAGISMRITRVLVVCLSGAGG